MTFQIEKKKCVYVREKGENRRILRGFICPVLKLRYIFSYHVLFLFEYYLCGICSQKTCRYYEGIFNKDFSNATKKSKP